MGRKSYRIDEFFGIDQSRNENAIAPGMSADACNMDTEDGSLAVARGYVRHIVLLCGAVRAACVWMRTAGGKRCSHGGPYACSHPCAHARAYSGAAAAGGGIQPV